MKTIRLAAVGIFALGSAALIAFGDPVATTLPTTGPMAVAQPASTQPMLAGGPSINNQYAAPTNPGQPRPQMESINTPPGSDSGKPVADVQIGAGVGVNVGQVVPNSAVPTNRGLSSPQQAPTTVPSVPQVGR